MVEFLRGLHCPVCRAHPAELDRRVDELSARGIDVIAVSAETCERPERLLADWKLERPPSPSVSLNHRCESGGCWSRGDGATTNRRSSTSRGFSSLSPDGKVYYESILSMPASQPASRPEWRNQPIERPRRRTARRLVRPVRAGSARRRSGQVYIQGCAHTSRRPASSTRRQLTPSDWSMIRSPRMVMARTEPVGGSRA